MGALEGSSPMCNLGKEYCATSEVNKVREKWFEKKTEVALCALVHF